MTDTTVALRFRERRVQLMVVGGLAMVLALGALVARNERALFVDGARDPKAFDKLSAELARKAGELEAAETQWLELEILREEVGA